MRILSDAPIGRGEPHYVQRIHRDKLEGVLPLYEPGTDPMTWIRSPFAIVAGEERIERQGQDLHVLMSAMRSRHTPDVVATGRYRPVPHHEHRADAGCDARLRDR
jgi:nitrous-oxide reductase